MIANGSFMDLPLSVEFGNVIPMISVGLEHDGVLEFGTEIVCTADDSLAALLGASPGASTSVSITLGLIEWCFPQQIQSKEWQTKIKMVIPFYGKPLVNNPRICDSTSRAGQVLF